MNESVEKNRSGLSRMEIIILLFTVAVCLKRIFIDFDSDAGYAAALGWRIVRGDRMFTGMWEPHQTSAFFIAFFEFIYYSVFGTTKGIVVYLNAVGVLVKLAVSIFLYRRLCFYFKKETAFISSCIFMMLSPKLLIIPEYSNLQLYSSVMVFCFLISFMRERKTKDLVLASVFLFCGVLAYPSCVLLWIPAVFVLIRYTEKGIRNSLILTLICLGLGSAYILYFVISRGAAPFFDSIRFIMTSDPSHGMSLHDKATGYVFDLIVLALAFIVIFLISRAVLFIREKAGKRIGNELNILVFTSLILTGFWVITDAFVFDTDFCFNEFLTGLLVCAIFYAGKNKEASGRELLELSVYISVFQLISTCILSNLTLYSSVGYMTLAFTVSAAFLIENIRLGTEDVKAGPAVLFFILVPVIFIDLFICRSISFCYMKLTDIRGISKTGPSIGILSEYMGPYILDNTFREFQTYIPDGSTILISGNFGMLDGASSLEYMDRNVNIGIKDTQTSCILDESQALYWEKNPERIPDIVVTVCWFGEEKESEDSWLKGWIKDNYTGSDGEVHYIDGMYRRYYYSPEIWEQMQLKMS